MGSAMKVGRLSGNVVKRRLTGRTGIRTRSQRRLPASALLPCGRSAARRHKLAPRGSGEPRCGREPGAALLSARRRHACGAAEWAPQRVGRPVAPRPDVRLHGQGKLLDDPRAHRGAALQEPVPKPPRPSPWRQPDGQQSPRPRRWFRRQFACYLQPMPLSRHLFS
jgi:hypothetical protein